MDYFRNTRVHVCLGPLGFLDLDPVYFYHYFATFPTNQTAPCQLAVFLPFSSCLPHLSFLFLSFLPFFFVLAFPKESKGKTLEA